jgi:hypothetical protein
VLQSCPSRLVLRLTFLLPTLAAARRSLRTSSLCNALHPCTNSLTNRTFRSANPWNGRSVRASAQVLLCCESHQTGLACSRNWQGVMTVRIRNWSLANLKAYSTNPVKEPV